MKIRLVLLRLAFGLLSLASVRAQDAMTDLRTLVGEIQAKLRAGQRSAAELAPELKAFDALVAKYGKQKTDEAAQIALMRATLYVQILNDLDKGRALVAQLKTDYPGTKTAAAVDDMLQSIDQLVKAKAAQNAVLGKTAPQLHFKWSSREGLKSLADLKGKVVVVDFWATWCGPCIQSFPEMRELVEHYQGSDVVVLGVTSIQGQVANLEAMPIDTKDDPKKEISLLPAFMKAKEMTWPVAISDEEVFNPDYAITSIPHMTVIAPDGTVRHNDLHPLMPQAEKTAKIDAILNEFHLPVPAAKKS